MWIIKGKIYLKAKRSTVIYAEILEEYKNNICLFKIENFLFKTKEEFRAKSNENVTDYDHALFLFKQTNL